MDVTFSMTEGDSTLNAEVQDWSGVFEEVSANLHIVRDDLLPFPLAGNKVRKLSAELRGSLPGTLFLTNGSIASNHCRTLAIMAARRQCKCHFVLHAEGALKTGDATALRLLMMAGARYTVVAPGAIAKTLDNLKREYEQLGLCVKTIAGGCHTRQGVIAYAQAVQMVVSQLPSRPSRIILATGTGATQAGVILGAASLGWDVEVVGVSVARSRSNAEKHVRQALGWFGRADLQVTVDDRFLSGGYGKWDTATADAVSRGWANGLPLDPYYTGKAFRGLIERTQHPGQTGTLFWHTGGLAQVLLDHPTRLPEVLIP